MSGRGASRRDSSGGCAVGFNPGIGQVGLEIPVPVATLVTLLPLPKVSEDSSTLLSWLPGRAPWGCCSGDGVVPGRCYLKPQRLAVMAHRGHSKHKLPSSCPLPSCQPLHKRRGSIWPYPTGSSRALYELNKPVT